MVPSDNPNELQFIPLLEKFANLINFDQRQVLSVKLPQEMLEPIIEKVPKKKKKVAKKKKTKKTENMVEQNNEGDYSPLAQNLRLEGLA